MSDKIVFIKKGTKGKVEKIKLESSSTIEDVLKKARTKFNYDGDCLLFAEHDGEYLEEQKPTANFKDYCTFVIKTKSLIIENISGKKIEVKLISLFFTLGSDPAG